MNQPTPSQANALATRPLSSPTLFLGIDTLWGGDVMNPSGTGRFIADSWFSDEPLPVAYTHPAAATVLRQSGGVAPKSIDRDAFEIYLRDVDLPAAIAGLRNEAATLSRTAPRLSRPASPSRSKSCGISPWKSSARAIQFPTRAPLRPRPRKPPEPSHPEAKRERVKPNCSAAPAFHFAARRNPRRRRCLASRARHAHGLCSGSRPGGHRALRRAQRQESRPSPAAGTATRCRAPTSISCPSKTHGSLAP
jgi:hypothetical protein